VQLTARDLLKLLGKPPASIWVIHHNSILWALTASFLIPAWYMQPLQKKGLAWEQPGQYILQYGRIEQIWAGKPPDITSLLDPGEYWDEIKPDTIGHAQAFIETAGMLCASFANGQYLIPVKLLHTIQTGTCRYHAHHFAQQILITDPHPVAAIAAVKNTRYGP
jgi:hypothetical protein